MKEIMTKVEQSKKE